ncbi:hypothetical protein HDU89_005839 [Geranomyces variabilis]|nr:hypothetical protein HDU89_005839 [Geranomyces variabilis]
MGFYDLWSPATLFVTAREFNILLDFIYLPAEGKQLMLSATNVVEAEVVAAAMQVPALTVAVKAHFARNPNVANWKNVQMLLDKATERQPLLESVRAHCAQFLSSEQGGHWIRVWYLAEQYDLTSLLNEKHYGNLPHDPWNDPFFAKLSDSLRSTLLLARVQNMWVASKDPHGGPSIPFKLGQNTPSPNGSGYHNPNYSALMRVHAPDAHTTRDIAATVVKNFPLPVKLR